MWPGVIISRLMGYAAGLRFPRLLALTAALFVLDVLVPDVIPFVDEILLGLAALLLGSLKKHRRQAPGGRRPDRSGQP
jgi:hypothetical protein